MLQNLLSFRVMVLCAHSKGNTLLCKPTNRKEITMLYNVMQQTTNGTVTMYNTVNNNAQAHEMLAQAETVTIGDNGRYTGVIGNKTFALVFTEKFIVVSYHTIG